MPRMPFDVAGRGLGRIRVSITHAPAGALIRLDDDDHPEWWLEIRPSIQELEDLLVQCYNRQRQEQAREYGVTGDLADLPDLPDLLTEVPNG